MNLESQVTSLELSKRLKELGVKQESLFYHLIYNASETHIVRMRGQFETMDGYFEDEIYSAFTVAELLELLPSIIKGSTLELAKGRIILKDYDEYVARYYNANIIGELDKNPANACAKMLIHLIENKLMEINKC